MSPSRPRRFRRLPAAAFAIAVFAVIAAPAAAETVRNDGVDVQQYRPGPGASDYLHVLGGFVGPHLSLAAGVSFNYAEVPLLVTRTGRGDKVNLLDGQGAFDLLLSLTLWERLEVGVGVPIVGMTTLGAGFDDVPGAVRPSEGFGLGDVRVTPKVLLARSGRSFAISIAAPMALPTGDGFAGYGVLWVQPTLIADFVPTDYFRLTLNTGGRLRSERQFANLELAHEITWGVGMKFSFLVGDQPISIIGSFSGAFELPDSGRESPPLEFLAGAEWRGIRGVAVTAGVGAGVTRGYGSPDLRALFGIRYSPWSDCVHGPEDYDGFQDDDDCADPDNDGDGIPDELDDCPNEPETFNGFEDEDGCPDALPDFVLLADLPPGTRFDSPTLDSDGDGIPDAEDACPTEPEDFDGFLDSDGCPDPDNDGDGILDVDDRCPDLAENFNGFEDEDGCPDDRPTRARVDDLSRTITIAEKVFFQVAKDVIQRRSGPLLDEIARILKSRPDILHIEVAGYTDSRGPDGFNLQLSQRRAEAVRIALITRGVAPERVVARGYGKANPIATNNTAAGREQNRRVEFTILDHPGGAR